MRTPLVFALLVMMLLMCFMGTEAKDVRAPAVAEWDADSSRILGDRYILWASRNATAVAEFLRFGQAVTFDTSSTSAEGWPVFYDSAITEVLATCGNATTLTPNCTLKVWKGGFGTSPTLLWAQPWNEGGTSYHDEGMTKSWSANIDVDKGDLLFIETVAKASGPTNVNYPNIFVVLRER